VTPLRRHVIKLVRRGGPQGQVDADVFGVDDRQRPGGLFFKNLLNEKGSPDNETHADNWSLGTM